MRKLFMTDLHGEYKGMMKLLEHAQFNPVDDQLVFGGDLIDRGKESGQVVKEVKSLCDQHPETVKAVIGNHEEMAYWYMEAKSRMWLHHGGLETIQSFNAVFPSEEEKDLYLNWLFQLPLYIEDESYVYTHAGLYPYDTLEQQEREILWMEESEFYSYPKEDLESLTNGKPIIHGHTPCEYVFFDGIRLNGDLGSHTYPILEERGLALVDLSNQMYYVYKFHNKKIYERKILSI